MAFPHPHISDVFVRQVVSGHRHGEAAKTVDHFIETAVAPFKCSSPEFVRTGGDGIHGSNTFISTPDITVRSTGLPPNGQPTRDSENGPIFLQR